MANEQLGSLEIMVLNKRLEWLKLQGFVPRMPFDLDVNFLDLMDDKWIFDGVLQTIHASQEMYDQRRDDAIGATLPAGKKRRGRKCKNGSAEFDSGICPKEKDVF